MRGPLVAEIFACTCCRGAVGPQVEALEAHVRALQRRLAEYSSLLSMVAGGAAAGRRGGTHAGSTRDTVASAASAGGARTPGTPGTALAAMGQGLGGAHGGGVGLSEEALAMAVADTPAGLEHVSEPTRQMVQMLQSR